MDFASRGHWKRQKRNYLWWRRRVLRLASIAPHAHSNFYLFKNYFFLYLDHCISGACSSSSFMKVWTDRENRRRFIVYLYFYWAACSPRISSDRAIEVSWSQLRFAAGVSWPVTGKSLSRVSVPNHHQSLTHLIPSKLSVDHFHQYHPSPMAFSALPV